MQLLDRETGSNGRRRLCGIRLAPEGKKLVMRIGPVHRGQRGTRGAEQPDVISTAVGGADEVSQQAGRIISDDRRAGKECLSTWSSRCSTTLQNQMTLYSNRE